MKQQIQQTLATTSRMLDKSTADFALGIREDTINDFLDAHFRVESNSQTSVYKGGGRIDALKLSYAYDVQAPAKLDIAPISPSAFNKIFSSWVSTVPELSRHIKLPTDPGRHMTGLLTDSPSPNVQVYARKASLEIQTDTQGIKVTLDFSIKVTAFTEIIQAGGKTFIRLIPISARLDEPGKFLAQLDERLSILGLLKESEKNVNLAECLEYKGDDPNCVSLRQLLFYIANVVIAGKISEFVKEFDIPVPIKLVDGVTITSLSLEVVDNMFVVLASVRVDRTFSELPDTIFSLPPEDMPEALKSLKVADLAISERLSRGSEKVIPTQLQETERYPDRGVFVLLHERLFQKLAEKYLIIEKSQEHCGGWLIFKYCYGWFLKAFNPVMELVNARLRGFVSIQGGGWIKGCIKTHCGDVCHTVSATLNGRPGVETEFQFRNKNELWVIARPIAFVPDWQIGGLPYPFNRLIEFFLNVLTIAVQAILILLKNNFTFRAFTFPSDVPGMPIQIAAKFDTSLIAEQKMIIAVGELDFEPK